MESAECAHALDIAAREAGPELRRAAVQVLAALGAQSPLDVLVPLMGDSDAGVRRAAVGALAAHSDGVSIDRLAAMMHDP
jgi:HEAT repeat protein